MVTGISKDDKQGESTNLDLCRPATQPGQWKKKQVCRNPEAAKCNESLRLACNQPELETDHPKLQLILTLATGPLSALPFGASPSSSLAWCSRW